MKHNNGIHYNRPNRDRIRAIASVTNHVRQDTSCLSSCDGEIKLGIFPQNILDDKESNL